MNLFPLLVAKDRLLLSGDQNKNKVTLHGNGFQALEWRHYARLQRDIMTLNLCTENSTISSRGPPNLSNFSFES